MSVSLRRYGKKVHVCGSTGELKDQTLPYPRNAMHQRNETVNCDGKKATEVRLDKFATAKSNWITRLMICEVFVVGRNGKTFENMFI